MSSPADSGSKPVDETAHQAPQQVAPPVAHQAAHHHLHVPTFAHAVASLLSTLIVAMFLFAFVLQPMLIPSESMERTLLVGDFLLFNQQVFAPSGKLSGWLMPYRPVERGDIVVFHHPKPLMLIKRVVGIPGDRIRIEDGKVFVNGAPLDEPYAAFEPAPPDNFRDNFPAKEYPGPPVDPDWWLQMQGLINNTELTVPPDEYFVMGDNRNHSLDSRYWGFVPREAIVARPLVIYFSLRRPSSTDVQQAADDRLGHDGDLEARLANFARWNRIFRVVR